MKNLNKEITKDHSELKQSQNQEKIVKSLLLKFTHKFNSMKESYLSFQNEVTNMVTFLCKLQKMNQNNLLNKVNHIFEKCGENMKNCITKLSEQNELSDNSEQDHIVNNWKVYK